MNPVKRPPAAAAGPDHQPASSPLRSFVRGGALTFVGFGIGSLLQFALIVVTTRGLTPTTAGGFFQAIALVTILGQWGQLGVSTGFERFIPQARELKRARDVRTILVAGLLPIAMGGVITVAVGLWLSHDLARLLFDPHERSAGLTYLRLLIPIVPIVSLTAALLSATRGWGTMRAYVGVQNIGIPLARPILMGAVLTVGPTALAIGLAWSIPVAVGFVAAAVVLLRLIRKRPIATGSVQAAPGRHIVAAFWRFTAPRGFSAGFLVTVTWLDVVLVGSLRSAREAAIYTATSGLAVIGSYALQAVGLAIAPQFSTLLTRRDHRSLGHLYRVSTWWMMALAWPFYLCLIAFAPIILQIFGSNYQDGATALTILAFAGLINLGTGNVTILLLMAGRSGWGLANAAVALLLNVGLDLLLIPKYGITGAAIGWGVAIVVNNVAALVEVAALLRLTPFGRGYWLIAASTAVLFGLGGLLVRLAAGTSLVASLLAVSLGALAYVAVLFRSRHRLELALIFDSIRARAAPVPAR